MRGSAALFFDSFRFKSERKDRTGLSARFLCSRLKTRAGYLKITPFLRMMFEYASCSEVEITAKQFRARS